MMISTTMISTTRKRPLEEPARGELRRVQPGPAGLVRGTIPRAAGETAQQRGDHGLRGGTAKTRWLHAPPVRGPRTVQAPCRPLDDSVPRRPLTAREEVA